MLLAGCVENLKRKRDALVAVLELLLEEGSDPSCRQGSIGPSLEVGVELVRVLKYSRYVLSELHSQVNRGRIENRLDGPFYITSLGRGTTSGCYGFCTMELKSTQLIVWESHLFFWLRQRYASYIGSASFYETAHFTPWCRNLPTPSKP